MTDLKDIDRSVSPDLDLVVNLATKLCAIPSPLGQEGAVAKVTAAEMKNLGFEVELQEVVPERFNVIGVLPGDPGYQRVVLNGHLDMPMPFGRWRRDPFQPWVEDGGLYGAGLHDMKGGLAAEIAAAVAAAGALSGPRGDIVVTAVMHHDTTGLGTKFFLDSFHDPIDAAICGEPTNLAVVLSHGGAWGFEIVARGVTRHQVRLEEGVDAIKGIASLATRLDSNAFAFDPDDRFPLHPRVVIGTVSGGDVNTNVADHCVARGDVRYSPSMSVASMRRDLTVVLDQARRDVPGVSFDLSTYRQQIPYITDITNPTVAAAIDAHRTVTGDEPPQLHGQVGISDAADLQLRGIPTVLYGPADWRTEPDERIDLSDLRTAASVYGHTAAAVASRPRTTGGQG